MLLMVLHELVCLCVFFSSCVPLYTENNECPDLRGGKALTKKQSAEISCQANACVHVIGNDAYILFFTPVLFYQH